MNFPWLTAALVLPIVGALVVMLLPRRGDLARQVALGFSVATLVLTVAIAFRFDTGASGFQLEEVHTWIEAFGAHYALGVDGTGLVLILLTAVLVPPVILASWYDGDLGRWSSNSFFAWILALEGLAIGTFASPYVLLVYVFFDATLLPIYFLIGVFGGAKRYYAAM